MLSDKSKERMNMNNYEIIPVDNIPDVTWNKKSILRETLLKFYGMKIRTAKITGIKYTSTEVNRIIGKLDIPVQARRITNELYLINSSIAPNKVYMEIK